MTDETEVKRWPGSLIVTAPSVIAAISLMKPDNVRVVVWCTVLEAGLILNHGG